MDRDFDTDSRPANRDRWSAHAVHHHLVAGVRPQVKANVGRAVLYAIMSKRSPSGDSSAIPPALFSEQYSQPFSGGVVREGSRGLTPPFSASSFWASAFASPISAICSGPSGARAALYASGPVPAPEPCARSGLPAHSGRGQADELGLVVGDRPHHLRVDRALALAGRRGGERVDRERGSRQPGRTMTSTRRWKGIASTGSESRAGRSTGVCMASAVASTISRTHGSSASSGNSGKSIAKRDTGSSHCASGAVACFFPLPADLPEVPVPPEDEWPFTERECRRAL